MSLPDMISDRTEALLLGQAEIPGKQMAKIIAAGTQTCSSLGYSAIAGIPCNTFHAQPIWASFMEALSCYCFDKPLELINMIDETINFIKCRYPSGSNIGIMSTTGTREQGLYSKKLSLADYNVIEPEKQDEIHQIIYAPEWGLKSGIKPSDKSVSAVRGEVEKLASRGAQLVILGCTELPIAFEETGLVNHGLKYDVELIDPMRILARALVKAAAPDKLL